MNLNVERMTSCLVNSVIYGACIRLADGVKYKFFALNIHHYYNYFYYYYFKKVKQMNCLVKKYLWLKKHNVHSYILKPRNKCIESIHLYYRLTSMFVHFGQNKTELTTMSRETSMILQFISQMIKVQ